MTTQAFVELFQVTTPTTGTGTLTLSTAATQCFGVGQLINGAVYDYTLKDVNGADVEVGRGTYTTAGTTLSRDKVYRSKIAGVEGTTKLTLSATGSTVLLGLSGDRDSRRYQADQTYIAGLLVTRKTTTTWTVKAGSCFDPSSGKIITLAADTDISPSLGNNQSWSFYLYDNAGTATIDAQQESPPATPYAGTARKRGSGNGGRFIGWGLTNGSANIRSNTVKEAGGIVEYTAQETTSSAPYRVINGGTDTAYATSGEISLLASATAPLPRYIVTQVHFSVAVNLGTTAGDTSVAHLSTDGTNDNSAGNSQYCASTSHFPFITDWAPVEPDMPGIWYKVGVGIAGVGPHVYLDILGFRYCR